MPKRIAIFIGAVGLVLSLFAGVASAGGKALTANLPKVDFGTVIGNTRIAREVVITNNSQFDLGSGTYQISGDVNLPVPQIGSGFLIHIAGSSCYSSGDTLSGTTHLIRAGRTCTFDVAFDPLDLPAGTYTAKFAVTFGKQKVSISARAELFRIG